MKQHSGFTLVELMITLALVAILATIGVPNFMNFIVNNRLAAQTNELVSALNLARSEAIKRNTRVTVCRSNNGTGCGGTWNNGWIVFVDGGTGASVDAGDEVLRVWTTGASDTTLTPTNAGLASVQFPGFGLTTLATFDLTATHCTGNNARRIDVAASGRISTTKVNCS